MTECVILATSLDFDFPESQDVRQIVSDKISGFNYVICRDDTAADKRIIEVLEHIGAPHAVFHTNYQRYGKRGRYVSNNDMIRFTKQFDRINVTTLGSSFDTDRLSKEANDINISKKTHMWGEDI